MTKIHKIIAAWLVVIIAIWYVQYNRPSLNEQNKNKKIEIITQAKAESDIVSKNIVDLHKQLMIQDNRNALLLKCIDMNNPDKKEYMALDCDKIKEKISISLTKEQDNAGCFIWEDVIVPMEMKAISKNIVCPLSYTGAGIWDEITPSKISPLDDLSINNGTAYVNAYTNELEYITPEMKRLNWHVYTDGAAQPYINLSGSTSWDRLEEMLRYYGHEPSEWTDSSTNYQIKPEVVTCIAKADSSLGKDLTTANNFWNVGNNDRWDRVHFTTKRAGIDAIWQTLNNSYLWKKEVIWELSPAGWVWTQPYFATSDGRWNNNVLNCLSMIYNEPIWPDFKIRERYIKWVELHFTDTPIGSIWATYSWVVAYHDQKWKIWTCGYHYFIGSDWTVKPCRKEEQIAFADDRDQNNYRFIQIAFAWNDKPNVKQTVSMVELIKKMENKYKFPKDQIYSHYDFNKDTKSPNESIEHWFDSKNYLISLL